MRSSLLLLILSVLALQQITAQQVRYTDGRNGWNADSLGNHRAVIQVKSPGGIAHVIIPWRRDDSHPENKRIILQDATGQLVLNQKAGHIDAESGEIWFEASKGPGKYFAYYMPYKNEGRSNYPKGVYLTNLSGSWTPGSEKVTEASVLEIQSIDAFNSFDPMEVIATASETKLLIDKNAAKGFLVFPEDRLHSIRMTNHLPQRWIKKGITTTFQDTAARGEYLAFQLGVYAISEVKNIQVEFSDLRSNNAVIPKSKLICINLDGTSYDNKPISFSVDIPAGKIQSMWCALDVPMQALPGIYKGVVTVSAAGLPKQTIALNFHVSNKTLADGGISQPEKQTRLKWLNSSLAQENTLIAPYTSLQIKGDTAIGLLGRNIIINKDGFPKQIQTFFSPEMTDYQQAPNNLLYEPIHFHLTRNSNAKDIVMKPGAVNFTERSPGTVRWNCTSTSDSLQMHVEAQLEFDGSMQYSVRLVAREEINFKDIVMHIPFLKDKTDYLMGLGEKGGKRPEKVAWKWDVATKNQDAVWIGNVNAGLQYSLRDEKYVRPLNTNFYLQKPLQLPVSWGNAGKGGIEVGIKGSSMLANNFSGERIMRKGDTLYYNFNLLITPFHLINTDFQWANRFYHKYADIDTIKATGATVINIHHATPINPYINYPFIEYKKMKKYIDEAHQKGLKVKIYNTVRELSNRAYELPALRSLGHEIFSPGKGGGFSWLQEHLDSDYIAAWFVPTLKDAAVVNSGMSRWHNYYVEGMNWLTQNVGIDGIYLDDVAFDRMTMKRIKRVLTANGHPGIIDLHSANQFNKNDGFNNSAMLYMEHFPYLNRLWFGEYFDYEKNSADFYLTEVSGIPFGLMGEMLEGGGNPWRGMIYGMTNRLPWSDDADPRPLWKVWDEFGIKGSKMIGYWSKNCPVKTSDSSVLATVFVKDGSAMIAIASWAEADVDVKLSIDWKRLGLDENNVTFSLPAVKNFQAGATFKSDQTLHVPKGKGNIIIMRANK